MVIDTSGGRASREPCVRGASAEPLLRVRRLCKHFPVYGRGVFRRQVRVVKAADQVTFDLFPEETLGLVGESGCGKTTTGRSILRAIDPTSGEVLFKSRRGEEPVDLARIPARRLKPLRREMQMIFQDPFSSLNPRMTVGDIVSEPLVIHGLARGRELEDRVVAMLEKVGLKPEHRIRYPHAFSGGQRQRVGIARALILNPQLIVADEAVSALDVSVQAQVINLMKVLQGELGLACIFIAHDLSVVRHICDRVAVMYAGRIVELASTEALFEAPRHPYTRALLSAVPSADPDVKLGCAMSGEVADPGRLPPGCSFGPRCDSRVEACTQRVPELEDTGDGRQVACHQCDRKE